MLQKTIVYWLIMIFAFFTVAQCAQGGFKNISVEELNKKITENPNIFILDVRTLGEYQNDGHIKGSTLIPVQVLKNRLSEIEDKKNDEIYVMCRSGGRSARASYILYSKGFKKVINVKGGMNAWKSKKYPTE